MYDDFLDKLEKGRIEPVTFWESTVSKWDWYDQLKFSIRLMGYIAKEERSGRFGSPLHRYAQDLETYISQKMNIQRQKEREKATPTLPIELDTDRAREYFARAIEYGLMDEKYKWLHGLQMLACFAREMSVKLNLGKGINRDGTKRINWRLFENLFEVEKGKLRSNYNDIQKTGQEPSQIELINKIFG